MPADFLRSATDVGGVHLVTLRGELDLASKEGLTDWLVEVSGSALVVDLSGVTFIYSSGISALIAARNRITHDGHELLLTRPQSHVRRLFEIAGISHFFSEWNPAWSGAG